MRLRLWEATHGIWQIMAEEQNQEPEADDAPAPGDTRAGLVQKLFREHNESLLRFLTTRLRSPQDAHEVAQEAYVRLLSLDEPHAVSYLRAFLFKTAANLAVDRLRRNEVRVRAADSTLFAEFADARTPERRVAGVQAVERLGRLVAAMPASCRRAFVLSRIHGMGTAEIAQAMKVSERAARMYVLRALLYCRAGLDEEV